MSVTDINAGSGLAGVGELQFVMRGSVVLRGDDDYARMRQIWNGAVEHQPAIFAVCETAADVRAAVRTARAHGFPYQFPHETS